MQEYERRKNPALRAALDDDPDADDADEVERGWGASRKALRERRRELREAEEEAERQRRRGRRGRGGPRAATAPGATTAPQPAAELHQWVRLSAVYQRLDTVSRRHLRGFRSIAAFAALHGGICEVSADRQHVILHLHDTPAPPPPVVDGDAGPLLRSPGQQRPASYLGGKPTEAEQARRDEDARELLGSVAELLPSHPVPASLLRTRLPQRLAQRLPLAGGGSGLERLLLKSDAVVVWKDVTQNNRLMVQRADLGPAPAGLGLRDRSSPEECVAALQELIRLYGQPGLTVTAIKSRAGPGLRNGWRSNFGGLEKFLAAYPQFFVVDRSVAHRVLVYTATGAAP